MEVVESLSHINMGHFMNWIVLYQYVYLYTQSYH